jgi:hypothetical protein
MISIRSDKIPRTATCMASHVRLRKWPKTSPGLEFAVPYTPDGAKRWQAAHQFGGRASDTSWASLASA